MKNYRTISLVAVLAVVLWAVCDVFSSHSAIKQYIDELTQKEIERIEAKHK